MVSKWCEMDFVHPQNGFESLGGSESDRRIGCQEAGHRAVTSAEAPGEFQGASLACTQEAEEKLQDDSSILSAVRLVYEEFMRTILVVDQKTSPKFCLAHPLNRK